MPPTFSAASTFGQDRFQLVVFPKRKQGLSYEEFSKYWSDIHGPIHAGIDFVKANMTRYEQVHKDVAKSEELTNTYGVTPFPYDGLVIHEAESYDKLCIWNDPKSMAITQADQAKFIEPGPVMVFGQVATFIDKPSPNTKGMREDRVRVVGFIKRKPGMSVQEFQRHWGEVHAEVYSNLPIVQKNITRYEQIHIDHATTQEYASKLGFEVPPYDGISIQEAESYEKMIEVWTNPEYLAGKFGQFL